MSMHPGFLDKIFRVIGRRNSVYCVFVLGGALVCEQMGNDVLNKVWVSHNRGKLYEDIPVLGSRAPEGGGGDEQEE